MSIRHTVNARGRLNLAGWAVFAAVVAAGLSACGSTSASSPGGPVAHTAAGAVRTTTPSPTAPAVTHRIVRKHQAIPFTTKTRDDSGLANGVVRIIQHGRPGVRVTTYRVTSQNGVVIGRKLIRTAVRQPIPQIKLHGTHVAAPKPSPSCDPNYSGACVPIASDVDCAGGSGNGPAYVNGPVRVVGVDIYDLDSDGDGYGCD